MVEQHHLYRGGEKDMPRTGQLEGVLKAILTNYEMSTTSAPDSDGLLQKATLFV